MGGEKFQEEDVLLRIFLSERQKIHGKPLYEAIVFKARELNLAGATVIKGILGFGAERRLHSAKLLHLTDNLPLIVEIIDSRENLDKLFPYLDEVVQEAFITLEAVHVIRYRPKA